MSRADVDVRRVRVVGRVLGGSVGVVVGDDDRLVGNDGRTYVELPGRGTFAFWPEELEDVPARPAPR